MLVIRVDDGKRTEGPYACPTSLRLEDGRTITGFQCLSRAAKAALGYYEVEQEEVEDGTCLASEPEILENYALYRAVAKPAPTWDEIRVVRNAGLQASDWTQLSDVPLSDEDKAAWIAYRQALRDITGQADPAAVVWPEAPG